MKHIELYSIFSISLVKIHIRGLTIKNYKQKLENKDV